MEHPFHISLPCSNVKATRTFYTKIVGAALGRHKEKWVDINLFGHQLTFTQAGKFNFNNPNYVFGGKILPSFHFGIILDEATWKKTYKRLKDNAQEVVTQATFLKDEKGEHVSFFVKDPDEYMLEFKTFKKAKDIFAD